jgi:membrane protein DedA with SNARE-associated domain
VAYDFMSDWPFAWVVGTLFVIVLLRAGGTYALGRGVLAGVGRTRMSRLVRTPAFARAERLVERWGAPVVVGCFLTVGIQTVVNLAAGVTRMPLRRYLPALAVGGLLWALLYATVASAGFAALRSLYALSPVTAIVVLVALVLALAGYVTWQVRRRTEDGHDGSELAAGGGRA